MLRRTFKIICLCMFIMLLFSSLGFMPEAVAVNIYAAEKVVPSFKLPEAQEWRRIDTKYCRFYFCQDEEYVRTKAEVFNAIYEEICTKFKHFAKGSPNEDGLVTFFLLDDSIYRSVTGDSIAGACFENGFGFINIGRKNTTNLEGTCRHELIHAVTTYSPDSQLKNYPHWFSEGIAQYYQTNLKAGRYNVNLLQQAIANKQLIPWSVLEEKRWGKENRPLKYHQAACMYEYLIRKFGEDKIIEFFYTKGDFYKLLKKLAGKSMAELETEWQKDIIQKLS
jgi:hypothetical protein